MIEIPFLKDIPEGEDKVIHKRIRARLQKIGVNEETVFSELPDFIEGVVHGLPKGLQGLTGNKRKRLLPWQHLCFWVNDPPQMYTLDYTFNDEINVLSYKEWDIQDK